MTDRELPLPTRGRYVNAKQLARYEAADKLAKTVQFWIQLGIFNTISMRSKEGRETRRALGELLLPWEDIVYPERESS